MSPTREEGASPLGVVKMGCARGSEGPVGCKSTKSGRSTMVWDNFVRYSRYGLVLQEFNQCRGSDRTLRARSQSAQKKAKDRDVGGKKIPGLATARVGGLYMESSVTGG